MNNPLLDKEFLKRLDLYNNKIIYARVFSLTRDELPVEEITGTITDGSISIDGSSSVRRTCNLTMVAREADITDYYWTFKTKIKLEIGVQNDIDDRYPEIIWFPQGIYVLTSFSSSYATNNCTISLSGKDKMCLLNGELGGVFNSEVCLDEVDETIVKYEKNIALTPEQFFAACEPVIVQNNKGLKLNKYAYYDFSKAISYVDVDIKDISSSRLKGQEVFVVENEDKEREVTKVYNKDWKYCLVKIDETKVLKINRVNAPCKLYKQNLIYSKGDNENYLFAESIVSINKDYSLWQEVKFKEDYENLTDEKIAEEEEKGTVVYKEKWTPWQYYIFNGTKFPPDNQSEVQINIAEKKEEGKIYITLKPNYYSKVEEVETTDLSIKNIIKEVLHEYGNESYYNIILNDIPKKGKELLSYVKNNPMYIFKQYEKNDYILIDKTDYCLKLNNSPEQDLFIKAPEGLAIEYLYVLTENGYEEAQNYGDDYNKYAEYYINLRTYSLENIDIDLFLDEQYETIPGFYTNKNSLLFKLLHINEDTGQYEDTGLIGSVIRIQQDEIAGYRSTDLTYPDELIVAPGETVTTALDKIKNMLGNYEYFYDLDGRFVFQEKKTFLNTAFSQFYSGDDTEQFIDYTKDKYVYTFSNNEAVVSVARSPAVGNIKNDFTIWGEKKTASGGTIPIHMRYAIDEKPITYVSWANSLEKNQSEYPAKTYTTLPAPEVDQDKNTVYNCDWRELIYQMALDFRKFGTYDPLSEKPIQDPDFNLTIRELNPDLCDEKGLTGYEQYYIDLQGFWRVLYNPFHSWENNEKYDQEDYFMDSNSKFQYWTQQLKEPENLIFWFDFLDTTGDLGKFSVKEIGHRAMAKTEDSVTAIKFRDTPPFIYTTGQEEDIEGTGFDFIKVTPEEMEIMFSVSSQGTDAETWINDNIYKNTLATETITLNTIPIYYLKPNALIDLITSDIYLNGEYIINKISYSLSHNGTMTISAIKNQPYIV